MRDEPDFVSEFEAIIKLTEETIGVPSKLTVTPHTEKLQFHVVPEEKIPAGVD